MLNPLQRGLQDQPITLAPMEEHTNFPFRLLMRQQRAGLVCTERRVLLQGHPAPPPRLERGRALPQLVEGEFRLYGPGLALRRLARTSCYFARFLPDFPDFRSAVHQVRDLAGFRRLVKDQFRA